MPDHHLLASVTLCALLMLPCIAGASDKREFNYAAPLSASEIDPQEFTFDPKKTTVSEADPYLLEESVWAINQRGVVSTAVTGFGNWVDQMLSGRKTNALNDSYLRIGLVTRWEKTGVFDLEPEARFRLDLPAVKDRLNIIIESEIEQKKSLSEQVRDSSLLNDETSGQTTNVAFRFLRTVSENLKLSQDVGIKLRIPPNPFWRARLRGDWKINDPWTYSLDSSVYYFTSDGAGSQVDNNFSRRIGLHNFTSSSQLRWIGEDNNIEWGQVFSLGRQIDTHRRVTWRGSVLGDSDSDWKTTEYVLDVTYRRRIYSNWLYYEVIPELDFLREDNFDMSPTMTFRIEMFFAVNRRSQW